MVLLAENVAARRLGDAPASRLGELRRALEALSHKQEDRVVAAQEVCMNDDGTLRVGRHEDFPVREHALGQLAAKLQIPGHYLRRCDAPLRAENVNRWLRGFSGQVMLRFEAGEVRAVLSAAYRPISHLEILKWLETRLDSETPIRFELTEGHLDLQLVRDGPVVSVPNAIRDPLHRGLHLRNSEVGLSRVEISALVFRQICLNGLVMGGGEWTYERRHVGKSAIVERVREAFDRALTLSAQAVTSFVGTRGMVVAEPLKALAKIAERYEFSEVEASATRVAHAIEPGDTLYAVINSVTRAGNSQELSLESRHKLQIVGGRLVALAAEGRKWLDD